MSRRVTADLHFQRLSVAALPAKTIFWKKIAEVVKALDAIAIQGRGSVGLAQEEAARVVRRRQ